MFGLRRTRRYIAFPTKLKMQAAPTEPYEHPGVTSRSRKTQEHDARRTRRRPKLGAREHDG